MNDPAKLTAAVARYLGFLMSAADSPLIAEDERACNAALCRLVLDMERLQGKEVEV